MEDPPDMSVLDTLQEHAPYLLEIKSKLFSVALFFIMGGLIGFIFSDKILTVGIKVFNLKGVSIVMTSPFQFVHLSFSISLFFGVIFALPIGIYQFISFVKPALSKKEYRLLLKSIPWCLILFAVGFAFGIWIMQFVIQIYASAATSFQVGSFWDIQKLFSAVIMTATLLGVIFQFPVILTYLMKFGFVMRKDIADKRRFIYAALMIFVLLLPPVDIFSDIILITPMILLFELTLLLNYKSA